METLWLPIALLLAVLLAVLLFAAPAYLRRRRRARLFATGLPERQQIILERNVPLLRRMPAALRRELHGHVNVFLDEKRWLGCGGLELTEEMRVTIAGHACILLLNRETGYFPGFSSIYVYPDTYLVDDVEYDGEIEIHGRDARAGESWPGGPVILSWRDVRDTIEGRADGQNVVLHEFAHKLDEANGEANGLPPLHQGMSVAEWSSVWSAAYDAFNGWVDADAADLPFDDYAATHPAEFFSVATEAFFLEPERLAAMLPDVYRQLVLFYRQDPASAQERSDMI